MQKRFDQSFAYIAHLIKSRCPVQATPATTPLSPVQVVSTTPTHHASQSSRAIMDGDNILIGGIQGLKIPEGVYKGYLLKAHRDRDSAKKLALLLTSSGYLFTDNDLATHNATGKSLAEGGKGRVVYPQLDQGKLTALCRQVKLEFPDASARAGDASCDIMQAINNVCRKKKLTWNTSSSGN